MRNIRKKTYNNFLLVMKQIEAKGYDKATAETITHQLFDRLNPQGLPMAAMIAQIVPAAEYANM